MQTALKEAVDGLYSAFAPVNRPTAIDYCTHCVDPGAIEPLLAPGPLWEIPAETLRFYGVKVLNLVGSVADFRYFLPRILQIAATEGFGGWPDLELVMRTIRQAEWRTWPASEQQAVTAFMHALWSTTLTEFPVHPNAEMVLDAISELSDDLGPYLRMWEAALATHAGASHLLEYVSWNKAWDGLADKVVATAESVTDEQLYDVLLEVHFLL